MMLTTLPTSVSPFASPQHGYSPGAMEKPVAVAATVSATPQLVPMAVPPPPFLIGGPGGSYTLLPSMGPINGSEMFGGIASLHPLGPFAGHGQPMSALPYYDMYHQQATQGQSSAQPHGVIATSRGGGAQISKGGAETVRTPPENKPALSLAIPPPPLVPVTLSSMGTRNTLSPATPTPIPKHSQSNSGGSHSSPRNWSSPLDQPEEEEDEHVVRVKKEMLEEDPPLQNCTRSNSDSRVNEVGAGEGSKSSYQISALIDVPKSLTRTSRTSSVSSSISSFRFGGSLNTLWASQLSLPGAKVPNMKSTGNLSAEAAALPSLGNQYFGGGSLPELSVTSLTRLLPPGSTGSEAATTTCPNFFTLFHSPLYVYPSQHQLATPFINANGSMVFGSFLSSGSSLCNSHRSQMSEGSPNSRASPAAGGDITGQENKVDNGSLEAYPGSEVTSASSTSTSRHQPLASYPSAAASPYGSVNVITALPAFSTLASGLEQNGHPVATPAHTVSTAHSPHLSPTYSPASSSTPGSSLNTLAYVATTQQRKVASEGASPPPGSCMTTSLSGVATPRRSSALSPLQHSPIDSKEGILPMEAHASGELWQMNGVTKMEDDSCPEDSLMPTPVGMRSDRKKERPYKCDHPGCGRSFSFPAHLRSHVQQIHISYRPCKCEFPSCGKRFYTPQHLNVHRRVHTGERPFVCPYADCGKAFTTAGNLKNHIRTHTGERPYACKFDGCSKRFAEMSSLKKHELTHTGEKPYKCRVCGKAFSQAGSRNTHERKHSRTDDQGGEDGKLNRRYRIKRVPPSELGDTVPT